jgi:DNA-binding Lrp family transcriptional regulator
MKVWAYVFITTKQPRKVVQAIRQIPGVVKADGLFGSPDAIAIVEGEDIASMDAVTVTEHAHCLTPEREKVGATDLARRKRLRRGSSASSGGSREPKQETRS